jgi:hypothetical protein
MIRLNNIMLNTLDLNRMGVLGQSSSGGGPSYEQITASGVDTLTIDNAKANSITRLLVGGGCSQSGTPTPTAQKSILTSKGTITYKHGTNLLEVKDANIVVGQYINNNGVVTASLPNMFFQRFIAVKANTAYTLSASEELNYANFMEYDANGAFLKRTLFGSSTNHAGKTVTHTMGASTAYVIIGSNVNSEEYPSITKDNVKGIKWMFNEGSKALTYQAYKGEVVINGTDTLTVNGEASNVSIQPLLGIGDYKDTQELVSGAVNRKVGIKVFDGSEESWYLSMSGDVYRYRFCFDDDDCLYKSGRSTAMLCTHFKVLASGSTANGCFLNGSSNAQYLFLIPQQTITDLEAFKQYLAMEYAKGTPVTIVYPLANESNEQVTAQAVSNPKGTVTIVRDAEVSGLDIEATLKVEKAQGGAEIEFFIDSSSGWVLPSGATSFKAKEGMTWIEWVKSEYNTYGLFAEEGGYSVDIVSVDNGAFDWGYESIKGVYPEDEITPNYTYITVWECSPGFQP